MRAHPGLIIISVLIKSRTTTRIRDSREVQIGAWAGGNSCFRKNRTEQNTAETEQEESMETGLTFSVTVIMIPK